MSENGSPIPGGPPDVVAQLVITLDRANGVHVSGPIDNRLISLGMLELAKHAINQHAEQNQKRVIVPALGLVPRQ